MDNIYILLKVEGLKKILTHFDLVLYFIMQNAETYTLFSYIF